MVSTGDLVFWPTRSRSRKLTVVLRVYQNSKLNIKLLRPLWWRKTSSSTQSCNSKVCEIFKPHWARLGTNGTDAWLNLSPVLLVSTDDQRPIYVYFNVVLGLSSIGAPFGSSAADLSISLCRTETPGCVHSVGSGGASVAGWRATGVHTLPTWKSNLRHRCSDLKRNMVASAVHRAPPGFMSMNTFIWNKTGRMLTRVFRIAIHFRS